MPMPPHFVLGPYIPRTRRFCRSGVLQFLLSRHIHSTTAAAAAAAAGPLALHLDITHPTYMIWGANTNVGKTLVSAGLAASVLRPSSSSPTYFLYLKPLQTGFPIDSDARFLTKTVSAIFPRSFSLLSSHHVLHASPAAARHLLGSSASADPDCSEISSRPCWYEETKVGVGGGAASEETYRLECKTLYGWREAISPHLAVQKEGMPVGDEELREIVQRCLISHTGSSMGVWKVIETAGGVASPSASGTLQCDLYRSFRLPSILVGDGRLGGISATISAYESLKSRGYDITAVILMDQGLSNDISLLSYLRNKVPVLVLPPVPQEPSDSLMEWFSETNEVFSSLQQLMQSSHSERIRRLHEMPEKAKQLLWWPFTQHQLVPKERVTVIDSRFGENFAVHKVCGNEEKMVYQFDACASWWTQGPDAALQIELAKEMGYSAGRYGHVMFPENVYEPALRCAEHLLEGVGKGWAHRVFFSDNGSTAIEIALKMAFRKFSSDHTVHFVSGTASSGSPIEFRVLALRGSYHGDTLGAMDVQAPSTYTGFRQQPWYSGRGLFLDPPTTGISNGSWRVSLPDTFPISQLNPEDLAFDFCAELFCRSRESSSLAGSYYAYISSHLSQFFQSNSGIHIGALIIEPVIQAAGGMHMIDPLFQHILIKECKDRKIPVIFDEVFTGFWRLGRESAAELLCCSPDIACYGKLLSGGVIPLAATLTTEDVFKAFLSDTKLEALLHGHSYTAHAMGCTAASTAIQYFKNPEINLNIDSENMKLKEIWDMELVLKLSYLPAVQRIIAMGTLCAIELRAEGSNAGYASLYANSLVQQLREDGIYVRPLGNVIYLMCGPCTSPSISNHHLDKVYQRIYEFSEAKRSQDIHATANFCDAS